MTVGDAGFRGDRERAVEETLDVVDNIDPGIDVVTIVHDHDRDVVFGDHARHVGIALQAPDVIGDGCAGGERLGDDGGLHAVDRHRRAERHDIRQHGRKALPFLVSSDRSGAVGPRRFRADVENVGSISDHAARLRQSALRRVELAAIGE